MTNSNNAPLYCLVFAGHNPDGGEDRQRHLRQVSQDGLGSERCFEAPELSLRQIAQAIHRLELVFAACCVATSSHTP